ncbi:MAG: S26 family signal peptidase, partial [Actinobacteria bacterium]|nr:S26 family signal peptidase [Actinomycetota bacterium]
MTRHAAPRRRWLRVAVAVVGLAVTGLLAFAVVWRVQGGRWERVETPSMGTVAPVGTLLWVEPVHVDQLRVGDFVTFHPPGQPGVTYSHRVYRIYPDHTVQTKGVIPAPDPWRLTAADLVGRVTMRWWGMGWLVQAVPILVVGGLLVGAVLSWLHWSGRPHWRLPLGIV